LISPETVKWCAAHKYPYVALATMLGPTLEMWEMYTTEAARHGYQAGPENFGYLQPIFVHETEDQADALGKNFLFGGGFANFARPEWMFPPGYNSKAATRRLASLYSNPNLPGKTLIPQHLHSMKDIAAIKKAVYDNYDNAKESLQIITGTPKSVIPKLRKVLEVLRPGIFSFWLDGPAPREDRMTCLRLLGTEVMPAVREIGKELGLSDPFEVAPGSRLLPSSGMPDRVGSPQRLQAL
jgi:alkanesulfonate monooxygenase SsuD/methylene tetrahydromethanopterin reductase-like flavin-dependent oxidoreductase (luciferase family)